MIVEKTIINGVMNNKEILNALMQSQSDEETTKIINGMSNLVWKPYGNNENNISTIHNQMDDPIRCLVENIVNGVDSMKMLGARKHGVDLSNPNDPNMPKSSKEAIAKYFGITTPLHKVSKKYMNDNLMVGVYAERLIPGDSSIIVYDYGEGQRPDTFEDTLLSINRGNKASLPFVQGKYNQGSTGVLKKCNGHRYELIVSMRNLDLDDADRKIGFTIVRYADQAKENKKYRCYEYMTVNGEIPYVDYTNDMVNFFEVVPNFKGGCIRKLYSYNVGNSHDFHFANKINSLFYDTGLPVKVTVPRMKDGKFKMESYWVCGINNKIQEREKAKGEKKEKLKYLLHKSVDIITNCGPVVAEYYVFPHSGSLENTLINGHAFSFIDGGQNNGDLSRTIISNECKLNQVAKHIMLFVHTDAIPSDLAIDMYKPSRERIDENADLSKSIISQLKDILSHDEDLRKVNEVLKGATAQTCDIAQLMTSIANRFAKNSLFNKLFNSKNGEHLKKMTGFNKKKGANGDEIGYTNRRRENIVVSLKPNEKCETTMAYGKAFGVELNLGETIDMNIEDMSDIIVDIHPLSLKEVTIKKRGKTVDRKMPTPTHSRAVEKGKIKLLVNPKTMGYYPEEKFEINFKHIHDETFNAVVQVSVVETTSGEKKSKNTHSKWNGPMLCLTAKEPTVEGVIPWSELTNFTMSENVTCKLIVEDKTLERIYVNLDSKAYRKMLDEGINKETAKNRYIEDVYVDACVDYLTLLNGLLNKLCKSSETCLEIQDTLLDFILEETEEMNSNRKCNIA